MPKNLHSVNNSGFYFHFMNVVNNPCTLDPDFLGIDKIKRYTNKWKRNIYLSGDTALNIQRK